MPNPNFLAVSVGNTSTRLGVAIDGTLAGTARIANSEGPAAVVAAARELAERHALDASAPVVLASVNDPVAGPVAAGLERDPPREVYGVGDDLAIAIGQDVDAETIVGVDRLLNAAAAWAKLQQACVVVDVGTAVTVDFVDGVGTFQGGAIAAGTRLQLEALGAKTAALPEVSFRRAGEGTFGKNTVDAMMLGVQESIRGLVWRLVERYSLAYGAFPTVIATGGDAEAIFAGDELVNAIVPDLTLQGIVASAKAALADDRAG